MAPRPMGTKHKSLNELFQDRGIKRSKGPLPKGIWAVRQLNGPKPHKDKVFKACDTVEAARQFFCFYGLTGQTYRYRLATVQLPNDHPLAREAIECLTPRTQDEMTFEKMAQEQFEDVERMIESGEAAAVTS